MDLWLALVCAAGAGFLLAVLWFDLMFDVQARRLDDPDGDDRLASIADYYRRVTIEAYPANRLVAAVMVVTVAASTAAWWRAPSFATLVAVLLILAPVALAGVRVVPNAIRLGARAASPAQQRALARLILRDHVVCFGCIAAFLILQLA
jgi:hypothetical protein